MKKALVVVLVIVLGLTLVGCSGTKTPEKAAQSTVQGYFAAVKSQNINKIAATIHPEFNSGGLTKTEYLVKLQESFPYHKIHDYSILFETTLLVDDVAEVIFILTVDETFAGKRSSGSFRGRITLKEDESKWLIIR